MVIQFFLFFNRIPNQKKKTKNSSIHLLRLLKTKGSSIFKGSNQLKNLSVCVSFASFKVKKIPSRQDRS
uniref:Uncharacterized protein n=1 Tax=Salix viminalis TaxID=40686 RepID=A0A6N2K4D3_SALVM